MACRSAVVTQSSETTKLVYAKFWPEDAAEVHPEVATHAASEEALRARFCTRGGVCCSLSDF